MHNAMLHLHQNCNKGSDSFDIALKRNLLVSIFSSPKNAVVLVFRRIGVFPAGEAIDTPVQDAGHDLYIDFSIAVCLQ